MSIGYTGDTELSCGAILEQLLMVRRAALRHSLRAVSVMYSGSGTLRRPVAQTTCGETGMWHSRSVAQPVCTEVFHSSADQTLMPCFPLRFIHSAVRFTQLTQWSRMMESDVITLSLP